MKPLRAKINADAQNNSRSGSRQDNKSQQGEGTDIFIENLEPCVTLGDFAYGRLHILHGLLLIYSTFGYRVEAVQPLCSVLRLVLVKLKQPDFDEH